MRRDSGRGASQAAGCTQIEVLTAMLIIGLATPFLMTGVMGGLRQARHSQDHAAAAAWVQGEIETLRRQCFERLHPGLRKVTSDDPEPGELALPSGFEAAGVELQPEGPALLRATVDLYRRDWAGTAPAGSPFMSASTYIADVRVAGQCP
jgi:type II secretory pathway pseudopilin PulG